MAAMGHPDWGGGPGDHTGPGGAGVAVADLVAPTGEPDVRARFEVRQDDEGYTVNGRSPGPLLSAVVGDLVEVVLVNVDVVAGATLHWHGVDVPNAADGVAGVTQDAVGPGEEFVYRFVADREGTYWYHSHQVSHVQVQDGLFGPFVIRLPTADSDVIDQLAVVHRYDDGPSLNGLPGTTSVDAEVGREVRVRIVNTDNGLLTTWVNGAPFEVVAIDGVDVHEPGPLTDAAVRVPAGGRVDLGFVVPGGGVRVDFGGTTALTFGGDPTTGATRPPPDELDPLGYGEPTALGLDPDAADRRFDYRIGRRPGFLDGRPGIWWTINGHHFPDVPMFMVTEGDVVVMRIENHSDDTHPMHLHGHHAVVLSRNDTAATGSPWWVDSLEVGVGETYEIAFVADNPGLWMDHCHNLQHAVDGLVAHLMYAGVTSSFRVGGEHGNQPE